MALFNTLRIASLATVLLFSLIVLGISASDISILAGLAVNFINFQLAVSVMTWAFIFPILLVSLLRRGSFLSWVAVELGSVGFLWVMWLATASYTTSYYGGFTFNCDLFYGGKSRSHNLTTQTYAFHPLINSTEIGCRKYQSVQAFSWLNWLILFAYIVLVLVYVVKATNAGRSVWTSDITDLSSFSTKGVPPSTVNTSYAPSMASTANTGHPMMASQPQPQFGQYQQAPYPQGVAYV